MIAPLGRADRASYDELRWASGCLALALLPHVTALPVWLLAAVGACVAIRLLLAARGGAAPPRSIRLSVAALAIGLLFLHFRTFNGLIAGTALLCLMAGLKLLETQTRRDIHIVTMIIYFLSLAALLRGESFWLLAYLVGVSWLTTATLLRLGGAKPPSAQISVRYAGRMLLQALPLALLLWLLFPRFAGPLWPMPDAGRGQESGLSDTMSPGDIDDLVLSDEVAFRVRFAGAPPPPRERYWRGPVLHDFDGHTWGRTDPGPVRAPALLPEGPAYRYTVSLEPNHHNWIFVLDWPAHWDLPGAMLTSDYMLVRATAVSQPLDVAASSYTRVQAAGELSRDMRRRDTRLPPDRNPRTLELARQLRSAHPDDMDYARAVLDMFTQQAFFYTLTPPKLDADSVDEFLFDTKRGFCGHYASAFAMLMRAAGIPARVVTGYQGGTFNRFADYWILRQSEAHAWDEIWIEGRGWLRVDPTTAIAPQRVERALNGAASDDAAALSSWRGSPQWLADMRLRLDALRQLWRERMLQFNEGSQLRLLELLRIPEPNGQKLAMVLAAALTLALCWLTWAVRRELTPTIEDPVKRAYERLCRKLAAAGLPRPAHEGAQAYASRVAALRPDLAADIGALCRHYTALRYGADPSSGDAAEFEKAVRSFRPRCARKT